MKKQSTTSGNKPPTYSDSMKKQSATTYGNKPPTKPSPPVGKVSIISGKARQANRNWSIEEDKKLAKLIRNAPDVSRIAWNVLAYQMENRNGKQCRERFYNKLLPDRKKGQWTEQEDDEIIRLQATLGNQWSRIATTLHGRTDNDVKNRWHTMQRSKKRKGANNINNDGPSDGHTDQKIQHVLISTEPARKRSKPTHKDDAACKEDYAKSVRIKMSAILAAEPQAGQPVQANSDRGNIKVSQQVETRQHPPTCNMKASSDDGISKETSSASPDSNKSTATENNNLTDNEVNLCNELLNLHTTLKKPDGPDSVTQNQFSEPLHDDYLFEHLSHLQAASQSSKGRGGIGRKIGAAKSTGMGKITAHRDRKINTPNKQPYKDQLTISNLKRGEEVDDIDKWAKCSALKDSPMISTSDSSLSSLDSDANPSASMNYRGAKWPMRGIKTPGDNDCLTGRGGGTNHHQGNMRYRQMVEEHKPAYKECSRSDKAKMSMKIVKDWRALDPPGRFLKLNAQTGLWDDIGDEGARVKCAQGLREKKWVKKSSCSDPTLLIVGYNQLHHSQGGEVGTSMKEAHS